MPFILHLDTSGPTGIAMLAKDGIPLATRYSEGEREHAGNINSLVDEALREAGSTLSGIDAIAVCNGPGSYTGLRIGLATAKGYCYALGKPLILHNRLSLMLREAGAAMPFVKNSIALLPARAGEYYAAAAGMSITFAPAHITTQAIRQLIEQSGNDLRMIGQVADDLLPLIALQGIVMIPHHILDTNTWGVAAARAFTGRSFADIAYITPDYLKAVHIAGSRVNIAQR